MPYKTYYQILGISRKADPSQIKKAFHKLSLIHHPDKNRNSKQSNRNYSIILNAYKTLSDRTKRVEYDTFLEKSAYLMRYETIDALLPGSVNISWYDILNRINISLWEIGDFIGNQPETGYYRKSLLIILTFLDKWVLEPYGFPDYFMEARQLKRIDPREYVSLLNGKVPPGIHLPYQTVTDYFNDIRKRADRFITTYEKKASWNDPGPENINLTQRIIEYYNLMIHYMSYLLNKTDEYLIPEFVFSYELFKYDY